MNERVMPRDNQHRRSPLQPLVSVITPTLNAVRYLNEMIMSIRSQDYPIIEHVVVDAGSTDGTISILEAHPGIVLVHQAGSSQAQALNLGWQASRGEIIGWLNADDIYLPGAVRMAVATLQANPRAAMVYANYLEIDESGGVNRRTVSRPFDLHSMLNSGNQIPQPTVFIRRNVLDQVGFVSPDFHYAMDYDLWIRIGKAYPIVHVNDYWAAFRLHDRSKSGSREPGFYAEMRTISRAHGGRHLSRLWLRHHSGKLRRASRAFVHADFGYFLDKAKRLVAPKGSQP